MTFPRFEIKKDAAGEFRFTLRSKGNGEVILRSSEGYTTKQGCEKGIASTKINSPFDERYQKEVSKNNHFYFILKAGNGEELGISEMYVSTQGRDNGISAVKRDAPVASVVDLTITATTNY